MSLQEKSRTTESNSQSVRQNAVKMPTVQASITFVQNAWHTSKYTLLQGLDLLFRSSPVSWLVRKFLEKTYQLAVGWSLRVSLVSFKIA